MSRQITDLLDGADRLLSAAGQHPEEDAAFRQSAISQAADLVREGLRRIADDVSGSKQITRMQELQLIGLQAVAATHIKAMDDLELAACEITGQVAGEGTLTSDMVQGSRSVRELLRVLKITVQSDETENA